MTPAARVQAAIEVLDRILGGAPAEQALTGWARGARFAGSGDRAAVRDQVFSALRCLRSHTALSGQAAPSGRALMMGRVRADGGDLSTTFTGVGHAPAAATEAELAALAAAPDLADLPPAVRLDCPDWLVPPLQASLGAGFEAAMMAGRHRAPVFLRVNLRRIGLREAADLLAAGGIVTRPHGLADTALEVLDNSSKIKLSQAYLEGLVELQDVASQAAVAGLPLRNGQQILDYCAGGGGKTLAMAARVDGRLTAHDISADRMRDLAVRAARAGVAVEIATEAGLRGRLFDLVLVDAPCSGSGTWRRNPDAKWRLTPAGLDGLTALQDRILDEAAAHVRPGGTLVYMTCSLLSVENHDRLAAFLDRHPDFTIRAARSFTPSDGGDGFFAAILSRP